MFGCAAFRGFLIIVALITANMAVSQAQDEFDELAELSIEDLMFMEVSSVSKKNQRLSETATAIFVLTKEDIRRSGANHIAEVLRVVPGLNVAQLDANKWAVSARGFNHLYANKLLVLVDGRTVYSPLFSGVHWDTQDFILEDIERVEVIRGPGATLWGANAVNGVINIITDKAQNTQGSLLTLSAGPNERIASFRYGGEITKDSHYRIHFKGRSQANTNNEANDQWDQLRAGFRFDSQGLHDTKWMIQGDFHSGNNGEKLTIPLIPSDAFSPTSLTLKDDMKTKGGDIVAKWSKNFGAKSELSIQAYYDTIYRRESIFKEAHDTYDLELNHRYMFSDSHEIIWGMAYRYMKSSTDGSDTYAFSPANRDTELWSAFVQDEIQLVPDSLTFIVGTKIEHNQFTSSEIQPNLRMIWLPSKNQTIWGAISRAVRTPSLNDLDARISASSFAYQYFDNNTMQMTTSINEIRLLGNAKFESEDLTAYELGYRTTPNESISFDATTFYNEYDNLIGATPETSYYQANPAPGYTVMPLRFTNNMAGYSAGLELVLNWQPTRQWKLLASYTYLELELYNDTLSNIIEDETPEHQFNLRSYFDLTYDIQFDTHIYYVDQLNIRDSVDAKNQTIDSYIRVDARLGWQPSKDLSLEIGGRNLFDAKHQEFGTVPFVVATEAERSYYLKATWQL